MKPSLQGARRLPLPGRTRALAGIIAPVAAALVALSLAGAASADGSVDEGRARFQRGIDLYKEANYRAALAEFRAADAAAPNWKIAYNLGQTLFQLQDYAGAVVAFEKYLQEGGDKIPADRRKEVEADLAKLRPRVAGLTVTANVAGAELLVDEESQGVLPRTTPLLVSAGRRRITVTAHDYQSETRVLDVAGATSPTLTFELKPIGGAAVVAPAKPEVVRVEVPATPPPPVASPNRTGAWIGLGATVALAGATTVFGLRTVGKNEDFEKVLNTPGASQGAVDDARSAARTSARITDVLGALTVVGAGVTVAAFVFSGGEKSGAVRAMVTPGGAALGGSF